MIKRESVNAFEIDSLADDNILRPWLSPLCRFISIEIGILAKVLNCLEEVVFDFFENFSSFQACLGFEKKHCLHTLVSQ